MYFCYQLFKRKIRFLHYFYKKKSDQERFLSHVTDYYFYFKDNILKCLISVKQEDCGLNFPDDFKTEVDQLKLDGNCDFGSGKF